jgi:hypothetical protein
MRRVLAILMAAAGVLPTGCLFSGKTTPNPHVRPSTDKIIERSADDFVAYLNRQAGYTQSVRYKDLDLKVSLPGQSMIPALTRGQVVVSQPSNFRMQAALFAGADQLDVGANTAEMWMYVKMSDQPYLYCSNADFPSVQDKLPVKFEPSWVMQALGMATYDTRKQYSIRIDEKGRNYQLTYSDTTAGGQRVLKMTEFAADNMGGTAPQVRRHVVMSEDGKQVIAEARIRKVSEQLLGSDPETRLPIRVLVPTELVLEWPQEQTKMDLVLGRIELNEKMTREQLDATFAKPARIGGASPVNLTDILSGGRGKALPRK